MNKILILISALCYLSNHAWAQSSTTITSTVASTSIASTGNTQTGVSTAATTAATAAATTAATTAPTTAAPKLNCNEANSINFNSQQLVGKWYAVATDPAPVTQTSCVEVNLKLSGSTLSINATYSTGSALYKNTTESTAITLSSVNPSTGYIITFPNSNSISTTYKVLASDYTNYAFICGIVQSSPSSSFGVILTRQRQPSSTTLSNYESTAAQQFTNFADSMNLVTQSDQCTQGSAVSVLPMTTMLVTIAFTMVKLFH